MKQQPKNRKARNRRKRGVFLLAAPIPLIVFSRVPHPRPAAGAASVIHGPAIGTETPPTLSDAVFAAAVRSTAEHGLAPRMLAVADMSQPSTAQRLYVVDMETNTVVLRTWIAHGQNSGDLTATKFSNRNDSHETSLGLYRVGAKITSPKHGPALLLHGLDKGINDQALAREVIIHGAAYVSELFIALHGRLGRSWGCPAVPPADMARIIELLADGGLLYVYGNASPSRAAGG
jgi:hypothetical protein